MYWFSSHCLQQPNQSPTVLGLNRMHWLPRNSEVCKSQTQLSAKLISSSQELWGSLVLVYPHCYFAAKWGVLAYGNLAAVFMTHTLKLSLCSWGRTPVVLCLKVILLQHDLTLRSSVFYFQIRPSFRCGTQDFSVWLSRQRCLTYTNSQWKVLAAWSRFGAEE